MRYPSTLKLPRDLFDRLALDLPREPYLMPSDIVLILGRPDEFTAADVNFCRIGAWDCLIFAAMTDGTSA
jgi:hypothetical protein